MSKWFNNKKFSDFVNKIKQDEEASENSKQSFGKMFPKYSQPYDTSYTLRFLPALKDNDPEEFTRKIFFHSIQSQSDGSWKYIVCPWTYEEKRCPICRIVSKLYASSENEDHEIAYKLKRQQKWISNVYVVHDPRDSNKDNEEDKTTGKVKVLEFGKQIYTKVKNASDLNSKTGVGAGVIDPEDGYEFILKVVKKKEYPNYEESDFSRKSSPLADSDEKIKEILDNVHSLEDYKESKKTSIDDIMKFLEDEMLIDYLEDSEKISLTEKKEESKLDSLEEDVETKDEEEQEEIEESEDEFLKKLEALDFDD